MKLGIDFGSTYTTVSKYEWNNDKLAALTTRQGDSVSIPSVVAIPSRGNTLCGTNAKTKIGRSGYKIFQTFKMLLESDDKELLTQKGYDDVNTPSAISKIFLENIIRTIITRYAGNDKKEPLEEIVICVPEIWVNDMKRLDQRNKLRDMIKNELVIDKHEIQSVHVVTEPEAASAYYAYNFEKNSGTAFNGVFLLIDYGGGTLDLTVTEVESDGSNNMEIHYLDNGGIGENHCGADGKYQIGQAGFAYMQRVVELAIKESEFVEDQDVDVDTSDFRLAQVNLEEELTDGTNMIQLKNTFSIYGSSYSMYDSILEDDDEVFCQITYGGELLDVSYQHLYRAYKEVIESTLSEELKKIKEKVEKHIGIDPTLPEAGLVKNFKIALVGGFCSFYLVRAQITEFFNFDSDINIDKRMEYIDTSNAEQAISLGAALISAGRVKQQKTARFSIGLYSQTVAGKHKLSYGIVYHQVIEPGKLYFLLKDRSQEDTKGNRCSYACLRGTIESFVIGYDDDITKGYPLRLKKKIRDKLAKIPEIGIWNCAFSMDEYEIISFHLIPFAGTEDCKPIEIRLDSYTEMFERTIVEELTIEDTSQKKA